MFMTSPIISFSGVDGSGKTTIINEVSRVFSERGKSTRYVWLRYNHYLTKPLLALCRLAGLTKYETVNGIRVGYHQFYRSKIVSYLFVLLTYIDTLATTILLVYIPAHFAHKTIICDRWVFDIMVDLEVDTGMSFASGTFPAKIFKALIPSYAICFLIRRDFQIVEKTRKENAFHRHFPKKYQLFERLANESCIKVVNNTASIQEIVEQIMKELP